MISKPSLKWSDHLLPRLILPALIASLGITGTIACVRHLGWLQNIELSLFDRLIRFQAAGQKDDRFLVVEITDKDFDAFQQIPLADEVIASTLEKLQEHNPRVIGLDIYRNIPNPPGTERLAEQLAKDNLIGIYNPQNGLPLDEAGKIPEHLGFNLVVIDPDNVQRRKLLALRTEHELFSFGLLVSRAYLGAEDYPVQLKAGVLTLGDHSLPSIQVNSGGYRLPDSEVRGWQTLLQFSAEPRISNSVTVSELLNGEVSPELIEDKIILIGSTARSQKDHFLTPYSATRTSDHLTPGVFLHAQTIQQILHTVEGDDRFFGFWTESQEIVWIFCWAAIGGASTWLFYRTRVFMVVSALSVSTLIGSSYGLFLLNIWVPLAAPAIALLVSWASILTYRLFYEERFDVLTGLPNRRSFLHAVSAVKQATNPGFAADLIAILSVDINRFKSINESYGHYYGDTVLKQVVQRIAEQLEHNFVLARMGANEFGILVESPENEITVIQLVNKIENKLKAPFTINDQKLYLTCSTGVALHSEPESISPDDLWLQAHTAMNRAKKLKKCSYQVFAAGMKHQSLNRLTIESDLRQAIDQDEFQLVYQPIFSLKTGLLKGFEALVRWNSPTRGLVSPSRFITIAEETDLILPIGQWVLEEGCRQFKQWQADFDLDPSVTISINLSSRQFSQHNLKHKIEKILRMTSLDPTTLKLEITESMVMDDIADTISTLNALKTLDVKLSIDDFGTGYSSLSYLSEFPVDTLKIDRSFVRKISKEHSSIAIPSAVVALGHNLGMDIIAEGIEDSSQLNILKDLDCEFGQGFFFSKPLSTEDTTAFIRQWHHQPFNPNCSIISTETN